MVTKIQMLPLKKFHDSLAHWERVFKIKHPDALRLQAENKEDEQWLRSFTVRLNIQARLRMSRRFCEAVDSLEQQANEYPSSVFDYTDELCDLFKKCRDAGFDYQMKYGVESLEKFESLVAQLLPMYKELKLRNVIKASALDDYVRVIQRKP